MIIHQIFLDFGLKPLSEREDWLENIRINKELNPNHTFKLWTDVEINELIESDYPHYKQIIAEFPHRWYLVDFARYLILCKEGGMYMDLDLRCKQPIPECEVVLGNSYTKPGVNGNVIKLSQEHNKGLLEFCVSEIKRIKDNNLYAKWKGRHLFNTVASYMFRRYCKRNEIESDIVFHDYFLDGEAGSWIDLGITKHYFKKTTEGKY